MDALAEKLGNRLRAWGPGTAARVRERIAEVMDLAGDSPAPGAGIVE